MNHIANGHTISLQAVYMKIEYESKEIENVGWSR